MKILKFINLMSCYLLLVSVAHSPGLYANGGETQLDEFLKNLDTLSATFEQRLLNEYGEELETSRGVLYVERPGMFRWAYTEPYSQFLITDGQTLWVYDEDLEQVTIRAISNMLEDSPAAILGGDLDIDAHYVVTEQDDDNGQSWLELSPRDSESQYQQIRLTFNEDVLEQMILFDSLGRTTQIVFQELQRNPELDRGLFHFDIPGGIDVIDARQ